MDTTPYDPAHVAEMVKLLRKIRRWTQENLADAAGLTTRTIEKLESGRHQASEQTLRSLARACQVDLVVFRKPTPEEERRTLAEFRRTWRQTVIVPAAIVRTPSEFLSAFAGTHAFHLDSSQAEGAAGDQAAVLSDWIQDYMDCWDDISHMDRRVAADSYADQATELEKAGYLCLFGHHRQRRRFRGKSDLIFRVLRVVCMPCERAMATRCLMVRVEEPWDVPDDDREPFPDFMKDEAGEVASVRSEA